MSTAPSLSERADELEHRMPAARRAHRREVPPLPPRRRQAHARLPAPRFRPAHGRGPSAPAHAGEADPARLLPPALRSGPGPPAAKRESRTEERTAGEDGARLPAPRHRGDRVHPRRPRLLGRAARRTLCGRGGELVHPDAPGAAVFPRRIGRVRIPRALPDDVRRGLPARALHRGRLRAGEEAPLVHVRHRHRACPRA